MKFWNPFLLLLCLVSTVTAQKNDAIVSKITDAAAAIESMECDFTQTRHILLLDDYTTSEGRMVYRRSNRLCWEYSSPYTYTFVLNGRNVTLKRGRFSEDTDVSTHRIFSEIARIMLSSVTGRCLTDSSEYRVKLSAGDGEYIARLTPQKSDVRQIFNTIFVRFDISSGMVSRIELLERGGDKTVIELKNIVKNQPVNENIFLID